MFNVGGAEMVVLAALALLVFGPENLPGIIKSVMRTIRAVRSAASDFQNEVKGALELESAEAEKKRRLAKASAKPVETKPAEEAIQEAEPAAVVGNEETLDISEISPESEPVEESSAPISDANPLDFTLSYDAQAIESTTSAPEASAADELDAEPAAQTEITDDDDDDDDDDHDGPAVPMSRPAPKLEEEAS